MARAGTEGLGSVAHRRQHHPRDGRWFKQPPSSHFREYRPLVADIEGIQKKLVDTDILSPREADVFACLIVGMDCADAGRRLFISAKTTATYWMRIRQKWNVKSIADLVRIAIRFGVLKREGE